MSHPIVVIGGSAGLAAIRARGGTTLVQDPDTALFADMPINAIARGVVDQVVTLEDIPNRLGGLFRKRRADVAATDVMEKERDMISVDLEVLNKDAQPGIPSGPLNRSCHRHS